MSGGDDFTAANIVYQLGDLLEVPAEKRQETNDQAIAFVAKLLNKHTATELRMVADQWEREKRTKSWWYYAEDLRTEAAALEHADGSGESPDRERVVLAVRRLSDALAEDYPGEFVNPEDVRVLVDWARSRVLTD